MLKESAVFSTRGAKAECRFELSKDLWTTEIDEGQINQVIGNLVINANQAMPGGGVITIHRADKLRYQVFGLKMDQVEATGAKTILSTCSNCRQSYADAKEHFRWDKDIGSLLELVAENLA